MEFPGNHGPSEEEGRFHTTHWSVVLGSQGGSSSAQESLAILCKSYWPPQYSYVRPRGHSPHDAQDLTQAFFERCFEKGGLGLVDRGRGRFRSHRRGGGRKRVSSAG